ncbi:MAG TPA: SgcJ/EcaC family oxidoreductase [Blastocatellia bacterium]|nr:SgcJ/EcaC family oxidoreductase [Blastocatellia bacterium]
MKKVVALSAVVLAGVFVLWMPKAGAANNEVEIRQLLDRWGKAFRAKDLEGVMSVYAPGNATVAYDIVPPLQCVGRDAYRRNYEEFFAQYDGPLDYEIRDLRIVAANDVAFIYCVERMSGTLKNGQKSDLWIRATSGLRKINGKWLIVHDHISAPVDFETGKAVLDLKP